MNTSLILDLQRSFHVKLGSTRRYRKVRNKKSCERRLVNVLATIAKERDTLMLLRVFRPLLYSGGLL
ncbi:hypothetical protein DR64_1421 [Paraburkholderia xenovorans LB400]|jgi:hypothetical protein|nr:hypothetical protein DR64_1421 [Paraburkholderia xenovorans LB400]